MLRANQFVIGWDLVRLPFQIDNIRGGTNPTVIEVYALNAGQVLVADLLEALGADEIVGEGAVVFSVLELDCDMAAIATHPSLIFPTTLAEDERHAETHHPYGEAQHGNRVLHLVLHEIVPGCSEVVKS